jgi:ATP-dependent DNA helicase 2 subunit 2
MALSDTNAIFAQRSNARSQIALSSLIHALQERELLALARLVTKDGRDPVLIMMAPEINNDFECLVDFQVFNYFVEQFDH